MIRVVAILILGVTLAFVGCSKKEGGEAAAAAEVKPFPGTLTKQLLEEFNKTRAVQPFQEWDPAFATLTKALGKPTRVEGKDYMWTVKDGDSCVIFSAVDNNGKVGAVGLGSYDKIMKSKYALCGGEEEAKPEEEAEEAVEEKPAEGAKEAEKAAPAEEEKPE